MNGTDTKRLLRGLLVCLCAAIFCGLSDPAAAQPSNCSLSFSPAQVLPGQGATTTAFVTCNGSYSYYGLSVTIGCGFPQGSSTCKIPTTSFNDASGVGKASGPLDLSAYPTGNYTFSAKACDTFGCINSSVATVTVASPPTGCTLSASPPQVTPGGGVVLLQASCSGGSPPTSYAWTGPGVVTPTTVSAQNVNVITTSTYTVTASNAAGSSTPATLTLVVPPLTPPPSGCTLTATPPQVPQGGGMVTLSASCSGGGAPTSYAWSGPGVTTPTATPSQQVNVTANSTFSVTPSNAGGNGNTATTTVTIATSAITLAPTTLPPGSVNVPYSQTITASGGKPPYTFAVTSGTLPAGLTLSARGVLSGTPTRVSASSFTVGATDSAEGAGSQSYTLTISNATGTLKLVSGDRQVAPPNTPLPQPLVAKVVDSAGNPVTGAAVSWAVGQGSGTITSQTNSSDAQGLVQASYTTGPAQINNTVVATATGSGSSITFTVLNEQSNVTIPARQLITPQGQAAFAAPTIQLNNIRQHLDEMRMARSPTVAQGLRLSADGQTLPMNAFALAPAQKDGKESPQADGKQPSQAGGGAAADNPESFSHWGAFVNGDIDIGRQSSFDTQTGFKATTHGVTAGVDYRFSGNNVLGAAVGYLKTDAHLDAGAGDQNTKGYSVSIFGSYVPAENAYIDGILNFGHNKYDGQRQNGIDNFSNNTSGNQWGLAVSAGYAFNKGPLAFTPFGRIEYVDAKVNSFTENGPAGALSIGDQHIKGTTLTLGAQASYAISTSWGVLIPNGRVEFQHLTQRSVSDVSAQLLGSTSPSVEIPILGDDRNFGNFAVGFSAVFTRGFSAFFNYQRLFGKSNFSDQLYTLGLRFEF